MANKKEQKEQKVGLTKEQKAKAIELMRELHTLGLLSKRRITRAMCKKNGIEVPKDLYFSGE